MILCWRSWLRLRAARIRPFIICDQCPHLIDEGPEFHFEPYDYGPFDSDVYSEIDVLQQQGEAVIARSPFGNWSTYAASDAGLPRGETLLYGEIGTESSQYIQRISSWVRALSFSRLVKSIYEAYPEMRANSVFRG